MKNSNIEKEIEDIKIEDESLKIEILEKESEGQSKDEILMWLFTEGVFPSRQERLWKETRLSGNWRSATVKLFFDNPETSKEVWKEEIEKYLKDSKNYLQHYEMIYSLVNKKEIMIQRSK